MTAPLEARSHHPQMPPRELVEWVELAVRYQEARLGNSMTEQTKYALMGIIDFMTQPAEAFCALHYQPCEYHEGVLTVWDRRDGTNRQHTLVVDLEWCTTHEAWRQTPDRIWSLIDRHVGGECVFVPLYRLEPQ